MPKIDIANIPVDTINMYPDPFHQPIKGRERKRLGNAVGLSQFGVNLTTLKPGTWSSQRHWHRNEDEFIYVLQGEIVLREEHGETVLKPGDAAGWKANSGIGHCLINRTNKDAVYIEVGTRSTIDTVVYSDIDMRLERDKTGGRYLRKTSEPYPPRKA
ncbi:cupin domain-containing protein [Rhodoplanes sp. Z2-YC6860]|uniref:cupin domain-containing protein n=1 Tax=Rhodoplanes sp. Z2-YC6860 TaxID=674703 RepID=UPI00078DEF63|nr:cupin domain-containing protein [Rhodoplanes sp. Z2-YC6860]AMN44823.1 cupin 2 conserved barrel domain-containing protein [Rhodoplanes sp. Z2-YC6860]